MADPYQILGVSKTADDDEIKKAYRKLSLRYHPDRNTDADAKEKFQEINNAYESIKTTELRQQHEMQGQNPFMGGGGGGGFPGGGGGDFHDINHMFNMMFGGGGGFPGMGGGGGMPGVRIFHGGHGGGGMEFANMFQQMHKPPPIFKNVDITMKQCYDGCSVPVEIDRWVMEGNIRNMQRDTIYVNIPAGIEESEFLMIPERGNVVNEQMKGDLKIGLRISNTTPFERMGLDLVYKKTITLKEALCGFSFEIRHLNDKTLAIHNKTNVSVISPGYKRVFQQMGMKRNGTIGNLIVEFQVEFPEKLTAEQMDVLGQVL
jgi:DnaJ family protein B protein 4